jgi:hypothetical protein
VIWYRHRDGRPGHATLHDDVASTAPDLLEIVFGEDAADLLARKDR